MSSHAKHRWLTSVLATIIVGIAFYSWRQGAFRQTNGPILASQMEHQVWVEACRPVSLREPLEVTAIGENGEKGLYCAPCGGVATDNDGGDAVYRFNVPEAGRYRLWGYCRWLDAEGDGFVVDIGGDRSAIRKTGPVGQWQWLPLGEVQVPTGVGRMTLTARGGGFAVRRMFLCNNTSCQPLQNATEPVDIFFDDFDGCEEGEFDSWNRISGQWTVCHREDRKSPAAKLLVGKSASEALLNVGNPDWRDYSLALDCCAVSASPTATAAVRFCCDQSGSGLFLRWTPKGDGGQVRFELLHEEAAGVKTLDRFTTAWDTSNWSELSIEARDGTVTVSINSMPVRTIKVGDLKGGTIGLWLCGEVEMMFDNVQVLGRQDRTSPATQETTNVDARHSHDDKEVGKHDYEEL